MICAIAVFVSGQYTVCTTLVITQVTKLLNYNLKTKLMLSWECSEKIFHLTCCNFENT